MRNLKKFLALVLAMMMAFSLMVTVNASASIDFTDKDSITDEFSEAVAVLEGLGVFQGYTNGDKFDFRPQNNITRAEVATIVYRLATGDAAGTKEYLYEGGAKKFKDVPDDHWASGAIGYCANNLLVRGYDDVRFGPNDYVTGVQAITMILRAVGYGQGGEFEGWGWETRAYGRARAEGLLVNVDESNYSGKLTEVATRELVAELLFQASLIPQVTWTEALGYNKYTTLNGSRLNASLAWDNFRLRVSEWKVVDKWGRPGYYWFTGTAWKADLSNTVATIKADPAVTYDTAVKECDVAHDLEIATNDTFELYVNRNTPITKQYLIEATDTVTRVGGQGRVTEFYETLEHPWNDYADWPASVVMIDTYLATVTRVTERVVDPAGHEIYPSYLYLDVHDGQAVGVASKPAAAYAPTNNTSAHIASKTGANWEYAVGDKVLVQGYTDYRQANASATPEDDANNSGLHHLLNVAAANKAAFETNRLQPSAPNTTTDPDKKINVVQKAEFKTGKQTVTYWNAGKHTVDGADYNDQMTLFLDVAGTTTNTTFAWYFDTKGNLIGIDDVPNTENYGVITSIWTSFNQGETNTDGTAKTFAKVLYADGTEATITIDRFLTTQTVAGAGGGDFGANGHIAPAAVGTAGAALSIAATGNTAELIPVYDYNVSSGSTMAGAERSDDAKDASYAGYLHIAPVASINDAQDENDNEKYGIIRDNLFKFEASADGNMTVIEVAGDGTNAGKFVGHYYTLNDDNSTAAKTGKLFKSYGYLSVDGGANAFARLDANTRIMVRGWDASKTQPTDTVNCYTLSTLPGDITIAPDTEIDWTDTNNDGRVDVLYITGTAQGTITYGLFYYNGGAAQWNGVDKKGTAFGWLNGEPTTINFDDLDEFNLIKNSQGYKGHLFALQLTNGVVSSVMYSKNETWATPNYKQFILADEAAAALTNPTETILKLAANPATDTTGTNLDTAVAFNVQKFLLGNANGNPYGVTTEAVYFEDLTTTATDTTTNVTYDPFTRTVSVWCDDGNGGGTANDGVAQAEEIDTFYLTANSKVIGLGMGVNQESAILDYLNKSTTNDVTIVYEQSAVKSIVEIYVATDPNVTPGAGNAYTPVPGAGVLNLSDVGTITNHTTMDAALKGLPNGTVAYNENHLANNGWTRSAAKDVLYFTFTCNDDENVSLQIFDGGTLRYFESYPGGAGTGGARYFGVNVNPGVSTDNDTHWIGGVGLSAGTYTFTITVNGVATSGTFSV